jgi:hypothetical protein
MSTKSVPGDGEHGKGSKGMPLGEPRRHTAAFVKDLEAYAKPQLFLAGG